MCTRALGVDNKTISGVHCSIAAAKCESGDVVGALESARECVRIFDKLGITNTISQSARDMLMALDGIK